MKYLTFILIIFSQLTFGQTKTKPEIDDYVKIIDSLISNNKLIKVFYPNMSACGGGLFGYYQNGELVLIDATYQAELGFSSKTRL